MKNFWNDWRLAPLMVTVLFINLILVNALDGWMNLAAMVAATLLLFGVLWHAEAAQRTIVSLASQMSKKEKDEDLQTRLQSALLERDEARCKVVEAYLAEAVLLYQLEEVVRSGDSRTLPTVLQIKRVVAGGRFLDALHRSKIPLDRVCSAANDIVRAAIWEVAESAFKKSKSLMSHPAAADLIKFCLTHRDDQAGAETPPAAPASEQ